jgi:hypothetical protein
MEEQDVFSYIKEQESNWKVARVPLTGSKDWNMHEHIERCTNVANGWFHSGKNDGLRPYDDLVTPIINVAFRSEGFDAKDIVPFVDNQAKSYMSFIIKKYAPQWNRKVELDTIIDDVVETSVIYDLALVKNLNNKLPEVIDLKTIAFCDQVDVLSAPLCLRHEYSIAELTEFKGKWNDEAIDLAISQAKAERTVSNAGNQTVKTPSKNIVVYELRGNLPELWIKDDGEVNKYVPQMHMVCFYTSQDGVKNGITLYKGKDKPLKDNFKALKIDRVRSKGRACGRSIVESLFEEQVWNNYSAIKVKGLLDSALTVFLTDSDELGGKKLTDLKSNTILKQAKGDVTQKLDGTLQNMQHFTAYSQDLQTKARIKGSASEAQLGTNPVSGTPFALQNLVVQQGQGIHEYRQGKIATFFADQLYRDWILHMMISDLNQGKNFSEELTLDELQEVVEQISKNLVEKKKVEMILNGELILPETEEELKTKYAEQVRQEHGKRGFFEVVQGELKEIPLNVMVNIVGKQKNMAANADKITNILREVLANPQAFQQVPGVGKAFNELLEDSGLSPIDFTEITTPVVATPPPQGVAIN